MLAQTPVTALIRDYNASVGSIQSLTRWRAARKGGGDEELTEGKVSMRMTLRCSGCNLTASQMQEECVFFTFPPLREATMTVDTFDRYSWGGIIKPTIKPQENRLFQLFVSSAVCGLFGVFFQHSKCLVSQTSRWMLLRFVCLFVLFFAFQEFLCSHINYLRGQ